MDFNHTEFEFEKEYPKLVRDNIPNLILSSGKKPVTAKAGSDEEYLRYLVKKVLEECRELSLAKDDQNMREELADILEIIYAVVKLKGWNIEELEAMRQEKRSKNGGFEQRVILSDIGKQ